MIIKNRRLLYKSNDKAHVSFVSHIIDFVLSTLA